MMSLSLPLFTLPEAVERVSQTSAEDAFHVTVPSPMLVTVRVRDAAESPKSSDAGSTLSVGERRSFDAKGQRNSPRASWIGDLKLGDVITRGQARTVQGQRDLRAPFGGIAGGWTHGQMAIKTLDFPGDGRIALARYRENVRVEDRLRS